MFSLFCRYAKVDYSTKRELNVLSFTPYSSALFSVPETLGLNLTYYMTTRSWFLWTFRSFSYNYLNLITSHWHHIWSISLTFLRKKDLMKSRRIYVKTFLINILRTVCLTDYIDTNYDCILSRPRPGRCFSF